MGVLQKVTIEDNSPNGAAHDFSLSFQTYGQALGTAPVVLVNHALTGNSNVAGDGGWWRKMVDEVIDPERYTLIAFDIPGNGFGGGALIDDYEVFTTKKIADLFWKALDALGIARLYAAVGGSLGGGITWEMALLRPASIDHVIPIACNVRSSDWLIANCLAQESILKSSSKPLETARVHAMLLYRAPQSFRTRFSRRKNNGLYEVEAWLNHHGNALAERFTVQAYLLMNHLLRTIGQDETDQSLSRFAKETTSRIHCIAIDSDLLFTRDEQYETYGFMRQYTGNISFSEIHSVHGHDAFLIEYEQLNNLLKPVFK
ncbi:MAG: alpha/beta fold hydrolase [Chryseobacterium sp.]|nr:MAG: alpha/beta fold hydrolase [Chryseobacterium sp.]